MNRDVSKRSGVTTSFWRRGWGTLERQTMAGNITSRRPRWLLNASSLTIVIKWWCGELVLQYVAELRWLTKHGEFGTYLDDALRDCFVYSLRSKTIQKALLMETDLTFQWAVETAHTMEMAAENARKMQSPSHAAEPVLHSRDIGKVSSNGQGEATNSNC